jgi:hypothetical protein
MKQIIHIALILALAAHGWAAGAVSFACRMSGEVSSVCCCAAESQPACDVMDASRACCDVTVTQAAANPAASRPANPGPEDNHHPAWTASVSIAALMLPKMPEGFAIAIAQQDSASPPPLILLFQSIRC